MAKKKVSQSQQEASLPKKEDLVKAHTEVKPLMESESSEKLESLKSLNQMLVKEAFERRQQVESLVQSKGCLELELTRSNSEKVSLNTELTRLAESAAVLELERAVVGDFVSVQLGLKGEAVEQRMRELKIVIDEKEGEIGQLNRKLSMAKGVLGNEREVSKRVCLERDEIKDKFDLQMEEGKRLRASLVESEERNWAVERELGELRDVFNAVETRFDSVIREKESIERSLVESNKLIEEMNEKVRVCVKEKEGIEEEKAVEMVRRQELEVEVGGLNEMVVGFQKEELKMRAVVADLEKECFVGGERRREMEREIDELIKEKKLSEKKIQGLSSEKITIERDLSEALTKFKAMVSENIVVVESKGRLESEVAELKAVVLELKNKIKGLESEVGKFEKVKIERDETRVRLDEEKKNVVRLKETIGALESKIEEKVKVCEKVKAEKGAMFSEKVELEIRCGTLKKEIRSLENIISEARKEFDSVKGEVGKADKNAGVVLSMLKRTAAAFCSEEEKSDVDLFGDGDETKEYVTELEMIKNAFKDKESKIDGMKRQLELLEGCIEDAQKKKSFWAVLSSATTLLAAVSLAYVARGH